MSPFVISLWSLCIPATGGNTILFFEKIPLCFPNNIGAIANDIQFPDFYSSSNLKFICTSITTISLLTGCDQRAVMRSTRNPISAAAGIRVVCLTSVSVSSPDAFIKNPPQSDNNLTFEECQCSAMNLPRWRCNVGAFSACVTFSPDCSLRFYDRRHKN